MSARAISSLAWRRSKCLRGRVEEVSHVYSTIICGRGSNGNAGDHHRAIAVASELQAVGKWDGKGRLVIHRPHHVHRELSLTPVLEMRGVVKIHQGIKYLVADWDFEILPAEGE